MTMNVENDDQTIGGIALGYTPETWMNYLYEFVNNWKELPFSQVCLPGTHDSATGCLKLKDFPGNYSIDKNDFINIILSKIPAADRQAAKEALTDLWGIVEPYVVAWSKTQYVNIPDQLKRGVRYFDCRMWLDTSGVFFHHGEIKFKYEAEVVFEEMAQFLDAHPNEILVLYLCHFTGNNANLSGYASFAEMITNKFTGKIVPTSVDLSTVTVDQLLQSGRVVLVMDACIPPEYTDHIFPGPIIWSQYQSMQPGCTSPYTALPATWTEIENQYLKCFGPKRITFGNRDAKLKVSQCHIQYDANIIENVIVDNLFHLKLLPSQVDILTNTAEQKINTQLKTWIEHKKHADWNDWKISIIEVDAYQPDFLASIVSMNRNKAKNW